jgi:outer membrane protein
VARKRGLEQPWGVARIVKSFGKGIAIISLLALGQRVALAQDLLQVYELAARNDPVFSQQESARLAALEAEPQAQAQLLPDISIRANYGRNFQDISGQGLGSFGGGSFEYGGYGYTLTLSQPIFRYDRFIQLKQADSQIRQAEAEFSVALQDLIVRVTERYFEVLAARDNLEFAQAEEAALSQQLEQANQYMRAGLVAITDVQEAQAGYDLAAARTIQAQNQLNLANDALHEVTGKDHEDLAPLGVDIPLNLPQPADIEQWTAKAQAQNLAILAAHYAVLTAQEEIKRQRAGHMPNLDLVANHGFDVAGGRFGTTELDSSAIGLQLQIPLYQGGMVKSRTRQAQHRYHEALDRLEQQRRSAYRQARDGFFNINTSISEIKALKQAVASSKTAVQATASGIEFGTRVGVDLVIAQRGLFQAKRDYARARYNYALNLLRLKRATGTLAPSDLALINSWLIH